MAAPGDNTAPVIIKRKKVAKADGHHGGAWKVAYADFVTAMMAFFLLMWLLGATTEKQRKGIADYFSPTVQIIKVSGGGKSNFSGDSVLAENTLAQNGETGVASEGTDATSDENQTADQTSQQFTKVEERMLGKAGESTVSDAIYRNVRTRVTDEGLVIELFERDNARLFRSGTDEATPLLRELADLVASAAKLVRNDIAVAGYTRARPVVRADTRVWDLSMARANAMRQLLETRGIATDRLRRVTGHADRKPVVRNPLAVRNNRVEVILLRSGRRSD